MKANEVKTYGQLEQFLNEEAKGVEIKYSTWHGFYILRDFARQVDTAFDILPIPRDRRNSQTRYRYYGTLLLGYITFKKTSDGKLKEVTLSVCDKGKSWLDAVFADEQRKHEEELKTAELLKERGFENVDELVKYLRELSPSVKKDIHSRVY